MAGHREISLEAQGNAKQSNKHEELSGPGGKRKKSCDGSRRCLVGTKKATISMEKIMQGGVPAKGHGRAYKWRSITRGSCFGEPINKLKGRLGSGKRKRGGEESNERQSQVHLRLSEFYIIYTPSNHQ